MPDMGVLFEKFAGNILTPESADRIVNELGVRISTLQKLGIGFNPKNGAFVFPERDEQGNVIGILQRFYSGKKIMYSGSKRGLIYEVNADMSKGDIYVPGKHNWTRVGHGITCPICGKQDGCLVPAGNPPNPGAVVCVHISEGAVKALKLGYLHILREGADKTGRSSRVLPTFEGPLVITEGFSDTATVCDMGLMAIGKPSAESGNKMLLPLVKDHDVIIIGDNDAGAGKSGRDGTFHVLKSACRSIVRVMPPAKYKDIRQWRMSTNLSKEEFLKWVENNGETEDNALIFEDGTWVTAAKHWVDSKRSEKGILKIRSFHGQWVEFNGSRYQELDSGLVRGDIYKFLEDKSYPKRVGDETIIIPFAPTRAKVSDVVDAANKWCPIEDNPPCWLEEIDRPKPTDLIVFRNGILDVNEYINGKIKLYNSDPALFTFNSLPYDFDENANSTLWDDFLLDIFDGDQERIRLLAQWFGYNCVPDMSLEKLLFCTGRPRSGKGTVLNAFGAMLGRNQYTSTSLRMLSRRFGTQPLIGKLAAFMADVRVSDFRTSQAALETLLHIVGGDPIGIERKHIGNLAEMYLTCRFTIVTNGLLEIQDNEDALRSKLNVLDFPKSYVGKEDFSLKKKIEHEAVRGLLINFALKGLKDLREQHKFIEPESSKPILGSIRNANTPIFSFVDECCIFGSEESADRYVVSKDYVYKVWVNWCKENGYRFGSNIMFGRQLLTHFPKIKTARIRTPAQGRGDNNGELMYVYKRLKLTKTACRRFLGVELEDN